MDILEKHYVRLKTDGKNLLKSLKSQDTNQVIPAVSRFQQLSSMRQLTADEAEAIDTIKLKHALTVIAVENGFLSWKEVKENLHENKRFTELTANPDYLYPRSGGGFLNHWYASYEEAKKAWKPGGYLLPYKNHYFICESSFIETCGLDPMDEDWQSIQWDWARPKDLKAWLRLMAKLLPGK